MSLPRLRWPLSLLLCATMAACSAPPPAPPVAAYTGPVLAIEQIDRGVQIVLPGSVLFESGQARFNTAAAAPFLDRVADLLSRKTRQRIAVEGHTDTDGPPQLNEQLSRARAQAVADALAARGVAADRLEVSGFSFSRPVAGNGTEEGKRLNRRVELIVLGEQVATLTAGEPAGAFESAWGRLKEMIDQGLVRPVGAGGAR